MTPPPHPPPLAGPPQRSTRKCGTPAGFFWPSLSPPGPPAGQLMEITRREAPPESQEVLCASYSIRLRLHPGNFHFNKRTTWATLRCIYGSRIIRLRFLSGRVVGRVSAARNFGEIFAVCYCDWRGGCFGKIDAPRSKFAFFMDANREVFILFNLLKKSFRWKVRAGWTKFRVWRVADRGFVKIVNPARGKCKLLNGGKVYRYFPGCYYCGSVEKNHTVKSNILIA